MLNKLEKKLNAWIIDLLLAGTSIDTKDMSPGGKTFYGGIKNFFQKGLEQMSHELVPQKKKTFRQKIFGPNK